jgi:phage terminase large subunit-like protein
MMVIDSAVSFMSTLMLENDQFWAQAATDEQVADALAVLDPDGYPRRHWLGRARGYSKTTDVAAMTLAAMACGLIPPGGRGYVCAADRDQAQLLLDAARGFIQRTPGLNDLFTVERFKIIGPDGTEVHVLASDGASAFGLRANWWVIDELCQWTDTPSAQDFYAAVSTTWPKVPGCRVVIMTTAGDPGHWARDVYEHADADELWRVSDIHGPPPWIDPHELASEKARLPEAFYRRMFLNEWAQSDDRLVNPDDLAACTRDHGDPLEYQSAQNPYLITVDLGLKRDSTAVMVSHRDNLAEKRPIVVDVVETWTGSSKYPVSVAKVVERIRELSVEYGNASVLIDPYQAAHPTEVLRKAGVRVEEYSFTQAGNSELAMALYQAIRDHTIELPDDAALNKELLNIQLREVQPGIWRIDHKNGHHDDMAVTTAMAAHWHQRNNTRLVGTPKPVFGYRPSPNRVY